MESDILKYQLITCELPVVRGSYSRPMGPFKHGRSPTLDELDNDYVEIFGREFEDDQESD
jgi:hypothetical protein